MVEDSEYDLVQRAKNGDRAALEELFVKNRVKVRATISRMLQGSNEVEDVLHNVFVKAQRSIGGFDGRSQFSTWLYRIAVNECLDHFKKSDSKRLESLQPPQSNGIDCEDSDEERGFPGPSPDVYSRHLADQNEARYLEIVMKVVNQVREKIGPEEAEAMELTHIDGISAHKVAVMLGFESPRKVYTITEKCRRLFQEALNEAFGPKKKSPSGVQSP